jgi:hypothetical protein
MKKGVMTEDRANVVPNSLRRACSSTDFRNAKAEPRRMIPNAAAVSGM